MKRIPNALMALFFAACMDPRAASPLLFGR